MIWRNCKKSLNLYFTSTVENNSSRVASLFHHEFSLSPTLINVHNRDGQVRATRMMQSHAAVGCGVGACCCCWTGEESQRKQRRWGRSVVRWLYRSAGRHKPLVYGIGLGLIISPARATAAANFRSFVSEPRRMLQRTAAIYLPVFRCFGSRTWSTWFRIARNSVQKFS